MVAAIVAMFTVGGCSGDGTGEVDSGSEPDTGATVDSGTPPETCDPSSIDACEDGEWCQPDLRNPTLTGTCVVGGTLAPETPCQSDESLPPEERCREGSVCIGLEGESVCVQLCTPDGTSAPDDECEEGVLCAPIGAYPGTGGCLGFLQCLRGTTSVTPKASVLHETTTTTAKRPESSWATALPSERPGRTSRAKTIPGVLRGYCVAVAGAGDLAVRAPRRERRVRVPKDRYAWSPPAVPASPPPSP